MRRLIVAATLAALALTACRSDGRDMRDPVFPAPTPTTTTTTTVSPLPTG